MNGPIDEFFSMNFFDHNKQYTAIIRKEGDWYIGWIEEIPGVNCQEHTLEELKEALQEGLADILEIRRQQGMDNEVD